MKAKTLKLQRPQYAKKLFPEIAATLQIEKLQKMRQLKRNSDFKEHKKLT